jgi:hypothetical protein
MLKVKLLDRRVSVNRQQKIRVKLAGRDAHTAYVYLPDHPDNATPEEQTRGIVSRMVCLHDLIESYSGPRVHFDFDKDGRLIGIEILVFGDDVDYSDEDDEDDEEIRRPG